MLTAVLISCSDDALAGGTLRYLQAKVARQIMFQNGPSRTARGLISWKQFLPSSMHSLQTKMSYWSKFTNSKLVIKS